MLVIVSTRVNRMRALWYIKICFRYVDLTRYSAKKLCTDNYHTSTIICEKRFAKDRLLEAASWSITCFLCFSLFVLYTVDRRLRPFSTRHGYHHHDTQSIYSDLVVVVRAWIYEFLWFVHVYVCGCVGVCERAWVSVCVRVVFQYLRFCDLPVLLWWYWRR